MAADAPDEVRIIPLMHNDHVGAVQHFIEVDSVRPVKRAAQVRIGGVKLVNGPFTTLLAQIAQAPVVLLLVNTHGVAALDELRGDAAQEMRVAVIPVRNKRVIEQNKV